MSIWKPVSQLFDGIWRRKHGATEVDWIIKWRGTVSSTCKQMTHLPHYQYTFHTIDTPSRCHCYRIFFPFHLSTALLLPYPLLALALWSSSVSHFLPLSHLLPLTHRKLELQRMTIGVIALCIHAYSLFSLSQCLHIDPVSTIPYTYRVIILFEHRHTPLKLQHGTMRQRSLWVRAASVTEWNGNWVP